MGCCHSSLSPIERLAFEYILTYIPVHCQREIIRLPPRKFLEIYQKHLDAEIHLRQGEYLAAIGCESQAIEGLENLLHQRNDHFIFADMHKILSICYWNMGNIQQAYVRSVVALAIRLTHTPTDYTQISYQYYRLALIYLVIDKWKEVEECLVKAIATARLSTESLQTYIQELEAALIRLREQLNTLSRRKAVTHHFVPTSGQNQDQSTGQVLAEMFSIIVGSGPVQVDVTEYERLPDKETESQVTDEILNDVLQHLEKYLQEDTFCVNLAQKVAVSVLLPLILKGTQMKTTSLSAAMIEAALTIIINQVNDGNAADDGRFAAVKQSPLVISYTDEDESRTKGVRVFRVGGKNSSKGQ